MPYQGSAEVILADASASTGGYGKIATVAATTGTLLVMCDNTTDRAQQIDWRVKSNQIYTLQLYRSHTIPTTTITFTDATAVDNNDTCVINGITFTALTSGATAASHEYNLGANNGEAATNFAALLTAHLPGASAASVAGSGIDTITITPTLATVLQFSQGTSDANEITWADTRIASLTKEPSCVWSSVAANSTTSNGDLFTQWIDGWDYAWAYISNGSGSAQTVTVAATKYA